MGPLKLRKLQVFTLRALKGPTHSSRLNRLLLEHCPEKSRSRCATFYTITSSPPTRSLLDSGGFAVSPHVPPTWEHSLHYIDVYIAASRCNMPKMQKVVLEKLMVDSLKI